MIKTKNGVTRAAGTKAELLKEFSATAEALMRRAPITADELIKAVKAAEMFAKIAGLIPEIGECFSEIGECFGDSEEPEAEDEPAAPAKAEEKTTAKKGAVKATVLEADDLNGMLEWLKGELENLEDESDD